MKKKLSPRSVPHTAELGKKLGDVYSALEGVYGPQKCFLAHEDPFQLLVATILSAQCTDRMVNRVTEELFAVFRTPEDFADAPAETVERLVRRCGYYKAKTRHILAASKMLRDEFGGKVPASMEALTRLPGVGRKTANVVLADAFGLPGFPVDTHVIRLTNLMGLSASRDPVRIEETVSGAFPGERLGELSHLFIIHGRTRCVAGRPDCANCETARLCRHAAYGKGAGKCR